MNTIKLQACRRMTKEADDAALKVDGHLELALDETFVSPAHAGLHAARTQIEAAAQANHDCRRELDRLRHTLALMANEPAASDRRLIECRPPEGFRYERLADNGDVIWRCRGCGETERTINSTPPDDHLRLVRMGAPTA